MNKRDTTKANNKKNLLLALEKSLGIVTPACEEVSLSRKTFYEYYKDDEEFKNSVDDINNIALDFVESQLFGNIKLGNERSILFYMRYKGKKRGYNETLDITVRGEQPLFGPLGSINNDDEDED